MPQNEQMGARSWGAKPGLGRAGGAGASRPSSLRTPGGTYTRWLHRLLVTSPRAPANCGGALPGPFPTLPPAPALLLYPDPDHGVGNPRAGSAGGPHVGGPLPRGFHGDRSPGLTLQPFSHLMA